MASSEDQSERAAEVKKDIEILLDRYIADIAIKNVEDLLPVVFYNSEELRFEDILQRYCEMTGVIWVRSVDENFLEHRKETRRIYDSLVDVVRKSKKGEGPLRIKTPGSREVAPIYTINDEFYKSEFYTSRTYIKLIDFLVNKFFN